MAQFGGPAAINGFLYQILQHLSWMVDIRLSGSFVGEDVKDACLILEPRNGGDAQALTSCVYLVEQYKTRPNDTWPLIDVIKVLGNLRKAVPTLMPPNAYYRFVTDGRPGRLDVFKKFLSTLKSVENPDYLSNSNKRNFNQNICKSDKEFFDYLIKCTRTNSLENKIAEEREILFHLLSRFEMEFSISSTELSKAIEHRLRPYVPDLGGECGVRERLVGLVMEKLSEGPTHLDADDLNSIFLAVGLSPDRLRKMEGLNQYMGVVIKRHMKYLKYVSKNDVRDTPHWPDSKSVLLVAGDSGTGKTWQLAKIMETGVNNGQIVVLVNAANTAEEVLTRAARDIWQNGLGETSDKSLQAVFNFFHEILPGQHSPLVTIVVDDIQNINLARNLIQQDWTSLSARLVLTIPITFARALELTEGEAVHIHRVGDFTVDELDALLKMSQRRWADLPPDLKRLLRKPILAGLFLKLSSASIQDEPQTEYEIFEAFWERIAIKCKPGDAGIITALAAHVHQGKPYPLPREDWEDIGLNDECLQRLEAVGWLRCMELSEVAFVHDRLLNWALAKHLVRKFSLKKLSVEELSTYLTGEREVQDSYPPLQFGYVQMDTLWLLTAEDRNCRVVSQLVEIMDSQDKYGDSRSLYTRLLPTLGQRIVPILLERLNTITADSPDDAYRVGLIGDAFAMVARQDSVNMQAQIKLLLNSMSWAQQSVAVKVLTIAPDHKHLDRLWEIHQLRMYAQEHNSDLNRYNEYQATYSALRAGVRLQPEWLRNRISTANVSTERISELGYLLYGLDAPIANNIWQEVRDVLMEKVPANNPRCLLQCIARFSDREKTDFVLNHLSYSEDIVGAIALVTLAILNPQDAINQIVNLNDQQRYFTSEWLALLLHASPELTRRRIRQLAQSNPLGERLIVSYFEKRPADLDDATLQLVLRKFESDLQTHIQEVTTSDQRRPYLLLKFLSLVNSPKLIRILQEEADGKLERMITEIACCRLRGNNRERDNILEAARRLLLLIGGNGILTLINRELDSEHFWVRHGGLQWALIRGDDDTIELLAGIASRPILLDDNGEPESYAHQEFCSAMAGLAALGADEILIEIIMNSGNIFIPDHLAYLRAHRGTISKTLTNQAVQNMQSTESSKDTLLCSLLTAWLSGDSELIPTVRAVLERAEPESQVASFACIALQYLGDESDQFAELAMQLAHTEQNAGWGLDALLHLKHKTIEFLKCWLDSHGYGAHIKHRVDVIRALYKHAESRELAVEAATNYSLHNHIYDHSLYEIAAEADNPKLREKILVEAFNERPVVNTAPLKAMRGVTKYNTVRAVEAIELGLQRYPKIERELCMLLLQVIPETAADKLIEAATSINSESLPQAVGRALRRLDPKIYTNLIVKRLSGIVNNREIVIKIAGWLPVPEIRETLGTIASHDYSIAIRRAALEALYMHRQEETILALYTEFQSEDCDARRWALFVTILDSADPFLLEEPDDSLWLGNILTNDVPYAFEHHACEIIKNRKKKL